MATEKQKPQNEEFMRQMAELTDKFNREMNVLVRRDKFPAGEAVATVMPNRVAAKARKPTLRK